MNWLFRPRSGEEEGGSEADSELARLDAAFATAHSRLLAERNAAGHWTGELAVSALSTATAIGALSLLGSKSEVDARLISRGIDWLADQQNDDGGWGDTDRSVSNISTTMLVRAAFHLAGVESAHEPTLRKAAAYLDAKLRGRRPQSRRRHPGSGTAKDHTFSVPILTTVKLLPYSVEWKRRSRWLPFELACFPQAWFRYLQLPVVSYALPALIALGQAIHQHRPPWNPLTRIVRHFSRGRSLRACSPASSRPVAASSRLVPLTSFVAMSLASIGRADHPVVQARLRVSSARRSVRAAAGSIDSNRGTWLTTCAVGECTPPGGRRARDAPRPPGRALRLAAASARAGSPSLHRGRAGSVGLDRFAGRRARCG